MPSPRETKWLGAVTLSVSCGVSVYFMTGEGDKAFFLALVLAVMLTLIVAFSPGGGRASARELYFLSAAVLVGPFVLLKLGYQGRRGTPPPAWEDLQARHAAKRPAPSGLRSVGEVVVNRRVGQFMVQPYSFKRASTTLGEAGVHLELSFPMSWVYDPVFVPVQSIRECRMDSMKTGYATLALREVALELEVADDERHVLKWCELHEIPDRSE